MFAAGLPCELRTRPSKLPYFSHSSSSQVAPLHTSVAPGVAIHTHVPMNFGSCMKKNGSPPAAKYVKPGPLALGGGQPRTPTYPNAVSPPSHVTPKLHNPVGSDAHAPNLGAEA